MTARRDAGPPSGPPHSDGFSRSGASHDRAATHRRAVLSHALEQSIIPRLLQAHPAEPGSAELALLTGRPISPADIREMARLVLLPDDQSARAAIQAFQVRGVPREVLYTDLLGATARFLGVLWERDECNFSDVTVGVGRLQQALRDLSAGLAVRPPGDDLLRRVLLVPTPGDQHSFGLVMVSEFFRGAGWDVAGGPHPQLDPVALARREWLDVVGFSLGSQIHLPRLKAVITAVRKASVNRRLGVLVGGPIFLLHPGLSDEVGADAVAVDGSLAPEIADKLVETRTIAC